VSRLEDQSRKGESEGRGVSALEPDVLMPSQYFDRIRRGEGTPERLLMVAVLESALNDYLKAVGSRDPQQRELFREVDEWVESRDATWLYSFERMCNVLGIEADYLRRGLRSRGRVAAAARPEPVPAGAPVDDAGEALERASA
jgi:hypothetical protein